MARQPHPRISAGPWSRKNRPGVTTGRGIGKRLDEEWGLRQEARAVKLPRASGVEKGTQPCWVLAGGLSGPEGFGQEGCWHPSPRPQLIKGKSLPNVGRQQPARLLQTRGRRRKAWGNRRPTPALPKQPGLREQELCALQPGGSAHKGAPRRPSGRCGRPQWRREVHPSSS